MSARGWVDEDEKIYLLQKASILLVPSTFEGQPLVVLESLACGLPVIVSDMVPTGDLPVGKARYQDSDAWKKAIQGVFDSPPDSLQLKESVDQYRITQVTKMWLEVYTR
jgi:glycosyltransferase involved in cell wall biosynthesis